jgi:hypothetical protein
MVIAGGCVFDLGSTVRYVAIGKGVLHDSSNCREGCAANAPRRIPKVLSSVGATTPAKETNPRIVVVHNIFNERFAVVFEVDHHGAVDYCPSKANLIRGGELR